MRIRSIGQDGNRQERRAYEKPGAQQKALKCECYACLLWDPTRVASLRWEMGITYFLAGVSNLGQVKFCTVSGTQ